MKSVLIFRVRLINQCAAHQWAFFWTWFGSWDSVSKWWRRVANLIGNKRLRLHCLFGCPSYVWTVPQNLGIAAEHGLHFRFPGEMRTPSPDQSPRSSHPGRCALIFLLIIFNFLRSSVVTHWSKFGVLYPLTVGVSDRPVVLLRKRRPHFLGCFTSLVIFRLLLNMSVGEVVSSNRGSERMD